MTNNPTARAPNPDRLTPPGVLASIPTRQDKIENGGGGVRERGRERLEKGVCLYVCACV